MLVRATAAERKLWRCIVIYIRRVQSERGAQRGLIIVTAEVSDGIERGQSIMIDV